MLKIRQVVFLFTAIFLGTLLLTSCTRTGGDDLEKLTPERKTEITQKVVTWLECEECEDGELELVLKEGDLAVPTLSAALLKGPSPASLELLRLGLEKRYDDLQLYRKNHKDVKLTQSKKEFVSHYMGNYGSLYRIRAAEALSAIASKQARKALQAASKESYREDVDQAVKQFLKKE